MNIRLLESGLDVSTIYWQLMSHPELWNQNRARTEDSGSPHYGLDDIWARFGGSERATDGAPHYAQWYPSAELLGVKQENISRMERRADLLLSTMSSYIEAMGGKLKLVAEFPERSPVVIKNLSDIALDEKRVG